MTDPLTLILYANPYWTPSDQLAANLLRALRAGRRRLRRASLPSALLPWVTGRLRSQDVRGRLAAARELRRMGARASSALPALVELREIDPDPEVREEAGRAVERIASLVPATWRLAPRPSRTAPSRALEETRPLETRPHETRWPAAA